MLSQRASFSVTFIMSWAASTPAPNLIAQRLFFRQTALEVSLL